MTNTPKILSNELDQAPKTGERYEKEFNNPEVYDQIIEAFSEQEIKEKLLNKPNMTPKDKENIENIIKFLNENRILSIKNIKQLEEINYGIDYIEIGGIKFSREKFIPSSDVEFHDKPKYPQGLVYESNENGVYKTIHDGNVEYYFTAWAYVTQAEKQGKKIIHKNDIDRVLRVLPGGDSVDHQKDRFISGNILGIILNLSASGYIKKENDSLREFNKRGYIMTPKNNYGFILSIYSPIKELENPVPYKEDQNGLATPCLFVVN